MNKHLYRVIFNHALGLWQAVSELVRRPGRGAGQANGVVATAVRPVSLGLWVAFGWIGFASVASAQIATDMSAPGNQRPTVTGSPGAAPVINITTPSKTGISRNTFSDFNVTDAGAVLNNSRTNTQTHLAGSVAGNPWLATGTAKVILNEVTGPRPSALNGYIEVAGDRAQVIVANPAGISCDGCGVINANRFTLTTGVPQLMGGALDSYRVTGGVVSIHGNGLDASRADYTDIIARAVQVNGGIWSPQLQVTTGANLVSADHTQVAAMRSSGDKPTFALDVSALGGMYANKIVLLGTEQGVGVRNAGTLGAQAGDLIVTADGRLENTGKLQSQSNTAINASGGVTNAGTLSATRELTISTPQDVDNRHGTLNAGRIDVDANALRNAGGTIAQTGLQAMTLHVGELSNNGGRMGAPDVDAGSGNADAPSAGPGSTIDTSNAGGSHGTAGDTPSITPMAPLADGALRISGTLNNDDGRISAASGFDLTTTHGLVNDGGHLDLRQLTLNGGNLSNRGGELAIDGTATVHAATLTNDSGQLTFHGPLTINAQTLSNRGGTLYQLDKSATTLTVAGTLDNTDGTLASNASALTLASGALINERGAIQHVGTAGFTLTLGSWQGAGGTVATASAANIAAGTIDHRGATLSATQLTFVADDLDNRGGVIVTSDATPNTLTVAGTLDNGDGGTLASNGDLQISATTLGNAGGTIQQAGQGSLTIYATALHGAGGTLASNSNLTLAGGTFDLRNGNTYAQGIAVDAAALTTAGGQFSAMGTSPLSINVRGVLDNTAGTIAANGALQLNAQTLTNTDGTLMAAGREATTLTVANAFDNVRGTLATAGATTLHAGDLNNTGGTVQAADTSPLTVTSDGALVNDYGSLVGNGAIALTAGSVSNHGGAIQAQQAIHATVTDTLDNSGGVLITGDDLTVQADTLLNRDTRNTDVLQGLYGNRVTVQAQAIDNTDGQLHANDTLALSGGTQAGVALTNAGGVIDGTGTVTVNATTLNNTGGQLIQRGEGGSLTVNASQSLNNTAGGLIGAEGAANLQARTLDNSGGTLFAQHDLSVTSGGDLLNRNGGQLQTQGSLTLTANGTLDNSGGAVDASGAAAVAATALANVGGQILAGDQNNPDASLTVVSGNHIDNRGGTLGNRGGDITLQAASIDNSAGGIAVAQRDLNLDNVGTFTNAGGKVVAARHLSYQNAGATLDNTNGSVGAGDTAWLNLGTLTNTAGQVQANTLWLTTPVLNNQDGDVGANTLHATLTNLNGLGTLHGTDTLDIHVLGDYTHQAGQHFNSDGVLSLTVDGTLTNQGTLQTQGELDVTAADLINQGTLNASATDGSARATLTIAGTLDNHEADASIAGDTLTLSANDIRNTSSQGITGDVVQINANTLTNGRDLGTADAAVAYGEGFIGASQYLELRIGQHLANLDGEIYSGGDFSIAGRVDGSRVATLDNVSGRIQAESNGRITADLITNRRRFIETEQYMLSPDEQVALSSERAYDIALAPIEQQRMNQLLLTNGTTPLNSTDRAELAGYLARLGWVHIDHVSDADLAAMNTEFRRLILQGWGYQDGFIVVGAGGNPGAEYKQTDTYLSGTRLLRESADSQILTGGDLSIDLGTHLTNVASTIAATGDLLISGQAYDGRPDARIANIAVTGQYTFQRDTVAWLVDNVPIRYPFVFASDVRIEPQAQVIYQSLKTNAFTDADDLRVSPKNTGAWLGRVGANLGKTFVTGAGQRWTPWMRVNYLWSSGSASNVTVASDEWGVSNTFTTGSWGQAWQLGGGVTGALTRTISVYANADYQARTGGAGEQGWSAGMGMRWQF
ncbi:filamentous hemagglutinin N-terminal domain-containing protein [Dyella silvae]|uniref:two-partner secretion domain-containing protein n=1 Tax=Dyella silvae TaxID=2994424 RepID=UPI0022643541|nr:filamentous hemagglutinin N-terminal domain-containing protein [Dyella silvae]